MILIISALLTLGPMNPTECLLTMFGSMTDVQCPDECMCVMSDQTNITEEITCSKFNTDDGEIGRRIDMISKDSIPNVTTLTIPYTSISVVPGAICRMERMVFLDLSYNKISKLPDNCFNKLSLLRSLSLNGNQLFELKGDVFRGLQKLGYIFMDNNRLEYIDPQVFSNKSDLKGLTLLTFENNLLMNLEPWPIVRAQESSGVVINLRNNRISQFTNLMKWSYRCGQGGAKMKLTLDGNPIRHFYDLLHGWNLTEIDLLCLFGNKARSYLDLSLLRMRFECDCQDFRLLRILQRNLGVRNFDQTICSNANNKDVALDPILAVPLDKLTCVIVDECPAGCNCTKQPSTLTIHVNCAGKHMSDMPSDLPPIKPNSMYRYNLTVSHNAALNHLKYFPYCDKLRNLDASFCQVESIDEKLWTTFQKIEKVNLRGNGLKTLPEFIVKLNLSTVVLDIANNPISCSCDDRWMKSWLASIENSTVNPNSIICDTPKWLRGRSVLSLASEEFCLGPPYTIGDIIAITIPSIVGVILLNVCVFAALRKFRVHIYKYVKLHPFDRDECQGEDMEYDVFLACAGEDKVLGRDMLARLERHGCKVCYHERDFIIGLPNTDNIGNGIEKSKRVLCILTNNFVQSGLCMQEFSMSHFRDVQMKKKRLILFLYESIDLLEIKSMSVELRDYLARYTYIERKNRFWERQLLYAMPINRMLEMEANAAEEDDAGLLMD